MKTKRNRWLQKIAAWVCVFSFLCPVLTVYADDIDRMQNQSSELQGELSSINGELLKIGEQIAKNEVEMEAVNNDIIRLQEQLQIAKNNEDAHYADMKVRIQYIYENQGENLLGMIFSAQSLADFVNKVHFVQTLSEYDRNMFTELKELRCTIEDEEAYQREQQKSYENLENELNVKREELNVKAAETSTDLATIQNAITQMKVEQAAKDSVQPNLPVNNNNVSTPDNSGNTDNSDNGAGNGMNNNDSGQDFTGGGYTYPSAPGQLNPFVGVVYFNGHRETYYSQRVLPGHGLSIPGRHVASDGTIRDASGYICVASSDYPKGTIVETSLGTGMVYDSGCASGTIDIYTDW